MKKLKYIALTTALSLTMSCAPAFAAEMPASTENYGEYIQTLSYDELYESAGVIFNGKSLRFDNHPVNIDGRVKMPFRELLEKIGATVDYDEATSKVSAERKGIKIEFFLNNSDKIYIDNNGTKSELQMDSSIDIFNDRTFVPVRFIAEAFGLSVGWDGGYHAVVITDFDGFISELNENCSNYMKLSDMQFAINENYLSNMKLSFSFTLEDTDASETLGRNVGITSVSQKDKERTEAQITLDFSALNTSQENNINLSNIQFNIILDNDTLYLSTNLINVLKEAYPDDPKYALAASVLTPDVWLTGSLDELFTELVAREMQQEAVMLSVMLTQPQAFNKVFSSIYEVGMNKNRAEQARSAANHVDTMKNIFGNDKFRLTENADGSYSFDYKFTNEDLAEYLLAEQPPEELSDEYMMENFYQKLEATDMNAVMSGTVSDKETNSIVGLSYSMDIYGIKLNINLNAESDTEADAADLSGTELPTQTMKLSSILKILKSEF